MSKNLPGNELLVFGKPWMKYIFFISLAGFILLTALIVFIPSITIDHWFSLEVQEHGNTFFDALMTAVSVFGHFTYSVPLVIITALVFFVFKFKRESLFILLTLLSGLVSTVVKYFVNRPRPARDLVRVIEVTRQQSFPSGHVLFYTVFFWFFIIPDAYAQKDASANQARGSYLLPLHYRVGFDFQDLSRCTLANRCLSWIPAGLLPALSADTDIP